MGAAHSKLAFKKSVFRLFEERNIASNANEYWEQFWTLPETSDDVFSLVSSADIRQVRDNARENLECLVEKTLAHLFRLVESPSFPSSGQQAPANQVLNCLRVLTRIFPFIFESEEWMDWEERYFWVPRTVVVSVKRRSSSVHSNSNSNSNNNEIAEAHPQQDQQQQPQEPVGQRTAPKEEFMELEEKSVPSHGHRLIQTLIDLLFTSGFTIPTAVETKEKVSYVIWETGIGSSAPIGTSKELEDNRIEVLRLLLVLFSRSMYITPTIISMTENRWIEAVVTNTANRKATIAILCSLINSAMKYNPSGWGLPYNHVMFSNDQRELLVMLCLQVILVVLNYQPIDPMVITRSLTGAGPLKIGNPDVSNNDDHKSGTNSRSSGSNGSSPSVSTDLVGKNQFRYYLSRLHREQDFNFLMDGMYRILSNPMAASSTYLPGSTKQVKCHQEMLMLCWKTLELNKRFRLYLLETNRVLDIVVILLYFAMENKLDPSHIGVVRMCACMLHTISADRAFGSSLNKAFDGHASLPSSMRIPNFHGTYGDFLIQSIHSLIATTKKTLRSLYPSLVMTLRNISPSLKRISASTAGRLLQLTVSFGMPSFLLAEASNHELLGHMLDTINYLLYYQAPENPNLIYAMVQYEPKLLAMEKFTLASGLEEIHRLRLAKERQMAAASSQPQHQSQQNHQQPSRKPSLGQRMASTENISTKAQQGLSAKRPNIKSRTSTISSVDTSTYSTFGNPLGDSSSLATNCLSPVYPDAFPVSSTLSSSTTRGSQWKPEDSTATSASTTPAYMQTNRLSVDTWVAMNEQGDKVDHLSRLDSTDSILAPPSDSGGHEGDVEDEGGPSTVPKASKLLAATSLLESEGREEGVLEGLSEKQRGKLPERLSRGVRLSSSDGEDEEDEEVEDKGGDHHHFRTGGGDSDQSHHSCKHGNKRPAGPSPLIRGSEGGVSNRTNTNQSLRTSSCSRNPLEAQSITSKGELLTTTAYDVGQNGFVPTEDWVDDWMSTMAFEPVLVTLRQTVPLIEQLHATTDQQVLEFLQREIVPRMTSSILPSYKDISRGTAGESSKEGSSGTSLVKPPIVMHKFTWGELVVWFEGLLWSQIYLGGMGRLGRQGMGAWHETRVRLFVVRTVSSSHQQQQQQHGAGARQQHQHSHVLVSNSHGIVHGHLGGTGSGGNSRTVTSVVTRSLSTTASSSSPSHLYNSIPRTIVTAAPLSPRVTTAPTPLF